MTVIILTVCLVLVLVSTYVSHTIKQHDYNFMLRIRLNTINRYIDEHPPKLSHVNKR